MSSSNSHFHFSKAVTALAYITAIFFLNKLTVWLKYNSFKHSGKHWWWSQSFFGSSYPFLVLQTVDLIISARSKKFLISRTAKSQSWHCKKENKRNESPMYRNDKLFLRKCWNEFTIQPASQPGDVCVCQKWNKNLFKWNGKCLDKTTNYVNKIRQPDKLCTKLTNYSG